MSLDDFNKRWKFGLPVQDAFLLLWKEEFTKFGHLVLSDTVKYVSYPDWFCPELGIFFEVKRKRLSWKTIERDDGMIWINKKSMDSKVGKLCFIVVFFEDKGWMAINAQIVRDYGIPTRAERDFDGSGDDFYKIRQILFEKFSANFISRF
jgi:hypothetical protein